MPAPMLHGGCSLLVFALGVSCITPHFWTPLQLAKTFLRKDVVENGSGYAINLGAGDGISAIPGIQGEHDAGGHLDPTFPLFHSLGFRGLAVEGDITHMQALKRNLPWLRVRKLRKRITPANVASLFRLATVPFDADYLKIDLDSFDCSVLYAALQQGYMPKLIHMEVNVEIAYPVAFGVHFHKDFVANLGHHGFYGCSLALVEAIGVLYGYQLVGVAFTHDVVLVRRDVLALAEKAGMHVKLVEGGQQAYSELVRCCLGFSHFGVLGGHAAWNPLASRPVQLLRAVRRAVKLACVLVQRPSARLDVPSSMVNVTCPIPYTAEIFSASFTGNAMKLHSLRLVVTHDRLASASE